MLSATDEYRSKVMEQVRISTERLSRVRNGTSLSNALDQQGNEVKRRFMESRRISNNILHELYDDYTYEQKPTEHEESPELSELIEIASSSKGNNKAIVNNKAAFRFLPELPKHEVDGSPKPNTIEFLLKKAPTFTQNKSVPRLRGLSLEDNYKKGPTADELNKEVMTRIWREEHESAVFKLKQLQAQQKLQAITDIEANEKMMERKKTKNDSLTKSQDLGQSAASAVIVKSSFKCQTPAVEKSVNMGDSNRTDLGVLKKARSSSVLKFRRDLTPEVLRPNVKRIGQNLKTFRLGQVAEVITIHDISKAQEKKRDKIEYLNNSPKRVQIRFVPSSEAYGDLVQRDTREIPNLMNKTVAVSISRTKNSVDYSMGVMRENMKFLVKERDMTQQKLTGRSKDDSGNMTDLRMDENKLYRKWPLASNSHSLNDSVQGSDYVDKLQPSHTSLGETTYLIKKYENYNSGRNERVSNYEERSKVEITKHPVEIVSNVSHNMSSLSRGVTSINSSQNDLKPKFQRSISQI